MNSHVPGTRRALWLVGAAALLLSACATNHLREDGESLIDAGGYSEGFGKLRAAGIRAEMYLGASGMNAQLKYADRRRSICAVIQGSNEREKGEVAIRDLVLGAELAASTKDRADYLELRQRAQFTVAEDRLVEAVREVLARHGG